MYALYAKRLFVRIFMYIAFGCERIKTLPWFIAVNFKLLVKVYLIIQLVFDRGLSNNSVGVWHNQVIPNCWQMKNMMGYMYQT